MCSLPPPTHRPVPLAATWPPSRRTHHQPTNTSPYPPHSHLASLEEDPDRKPRLKREVLCSTLAGNCCDILTVTSPTTNAEVLKKRRGIMISGGG